MIFFTYMMFLTLTSTIIVITQLKATVVNTDSLQECQLLQLSGVL